MNCNLCDATFNTLENVPKILPCLGISCLKCLQTMPTYSNECLVNCSHCSQVHIVSSNLKDLPTSEITLHMISNENKPVVNVKTFSQDLNYYLKSENYDIYKHYDYVICDIDIKAEMLIQSIHASRERLQAKAKQHLDATLTILDSDSKIDENMDTDVKEIICIKNRLINLGETNVKELDSIISDSHRLENYLNDLKKNAQYFSENSSKLEHTSLLGHIVNPLFDANYKKILSLNEMFKNVDENDKVKLEWKYRELSTRKEVFPLKNKYVKMYFTCKRTILLEAFDLSGKLVNTVEHFEDISSFPTSSCFGDYFVIGFSASHVNYIHLLDSELNIVRTKKIRNLAESCYMNEDNILLFFENRPQECCDLFDHQFKLIKSFGQQTKEDEPFYMKKSIVCNPEEKKFGFKINPRVFGMTKRYFYMSNYNKVSMMCRVTGKEVKKIELGGFRPYFMIDLQENILQVNTLEKRLAIYNSDFEFLAESTYDDEYDCVHVNPRNKLVFLGLEKKNLVVV